MPSQFSFETILDSRKKSPTAITITTGKRLSKTMTLKTNSPPKIILTVTTSRLYYSNSKVTTYFPNNGSFDKTAGYLRLEIPILNLQGNIKVEATPFHNSHLIRPVPDEI